MQDVKDLELILRTQIPIIFVDTFEETRALQLVTQMAIKHEKGLYTWTATDGLVHGSIDHPQINPEHLEPEEALNHIRFIKTPCIFALCDLQYYLNEPKNIRYLKDMALSYERTQSTVIIIGHNVVAPEALKRYSANFRLSLPDESGLKSIVLEEADKWMQRNNGRRVRTDQDTLGKFVRNLKGLTQVDARRVIINAIDDGMINDDDMPSATEAKFELMNLDGILNFEHSKTNMEEIGGLDNLKNWVNQRREYFLKPNEAKMDVPKGLLLLGVQGGGKSLAAKAVSHCLGVPLLRLDMGAIFNKFQGETERNIRETLQLADQTSPCVLWLDEIEKGLSQSFHEDATAKRVLGTLLTWMAERTSQVFMVATSNDISKLPPELLRKGRFDEIFFVDLPDVSARQTIIEIHLKKRGFDLEDFDARYIADNSEGFSGAELEQAIVSAIYHSRSLDSLLKDEHIVHSIVSTMPLSVTMKEQIEQLRQWANERAVLA
ncbi:AAA family ATPase [Marinicellulosiphila megalodicopiae]|uniref:AAA family ATPase n=1 Tax=Marinicellulosiphila megalodicopiae TaxID=2724896 RepID=UPI003BAF77B3